MPACRMHATTRVHGVHPLGQRRMEITSLRRAPEYCQTERDWSKVRSTSVGMRRSGFSNRPVLPAGPPVNNEFSDYINRRGRRGPSSEG